MPQFGALGPFCHHLRPIVAIQAGNGRSLDRPAIAFNALGSALQTQYTSTGLVLTQSDYAGNLDYTFYDRRDQAVLNYDPASDLATYSVYDTAGQVISQTSGRTEVNSIVTGGEFYTLQRRERPSMRMIDSDAAT